MSGRVGDLSDKQKETLGKFKESVKDILQPRHDDAVLLKFLRARRFDLPKAEKMIRKDAAWRAENKVDTLMEWFTVPEVYTKHWAGGISGLDKEGHAVYIMDFGSLDERGIVYSAKTSDILKTNLYYFEEMVKMQKDMTIKKYGHEIDGATVIVDFEFFSFHHLWKPGIDVLNKVIATMEKHYPELIYHLYVVRPAKIFPIFFNLIKPFIQEDTRNKIEVLGKNWKEVLLSKIDPDELPAFWGGNKKDPDGNPKCVQLIKPAGKIDKKYYLKRQEPKHDYATHEIGRGAALEFKYVVNKPDSVLRYEFQTKSGDMKFGFERADSSGKRTPIMKVQKYNSHQVPEDGEVMLDQPGTYFAKFQNDSWTGSKKLSYWLECLEPSDEDPEFLETGEEFISIND